MVPCCACAEQGLYLNSACAAGAGEDRTSQVCAGGGAGATVETHASAETTTGTTTAADDARPASPRYNT